MKIKRITGLFLKKLGLIQPKPLFFDISRSERIVEYSWILKNFGLEKDKILDIGCCGTLFPIML